ncbi:GNAT family N-acetyltransferase [Kitasatospora aureofaciens]|uniref:GNAT family N-acetyltransferase n=1 Tax=Kitasatospora aureofaciens TaxID=1894 RepID=UPI001C4832BE|nr:GNAT family N-acetyltransferase [Kitasatospora aureofaciens]MBV6699544.1 GNAT family N-acetyltransferase [Kitasatospora aureofaciens]
MTARPARPARPADLPGFLALAAEVEHWFGPMVDDPGFQRAVTKHIDRELATVVDGGPDGGLLGGLLFGGEPPAHHLHWLVVAERARGTGVGRALVADVLRRHVRGPATVEVVTFGADHPGAVASGARVFYERLGFAPAEAAGPGPEGGSRQVYRLSVH